MNPFVSQELPAAFVRQDEPMSVQRIKAGKLRLWIPEEAFEHALHTLPLSLT